MTRFGVPRSVSRAPTRRRHPERHQSPRKSLTYAAPSDSSESEYDSDASAISSPSTDSFCYGSESEVPKLQVKPNRAITDPAEMRYITETVAAIRLRTRHHDPYEEWEKQTRKDAFRTARKDQLVRESQLHDKQDLVRARQAQRLAALHAADAAQVQAQLDAMRNEQQREEVRMREAWKIRDTTLWTRIDSVIKFEQDKVQAQLNEEKRIKEEAERKLREEKLRLELIEQKKKQEEEEKKRLEEEERVKLEKERAAAEKLRAEQLERDAEIRKKTGLTTALDDWKVARETLRSLKQGPLTVVKGNTGSGSMKALWGSLRREVRTKIGQLTDDPASIRNKSQEILSIVKPNPPLHPDVYHATLSAIAKLFLEQAETETATSASSAGPMGQVLVTLLDSLETFPDIFFAKLMQRVGPWVIPIALPSTDSDGKPWADAAAARKAMGFRTSSGDEEDGGGQAEEGQIEYQQRVSGMMRVYFHVLKTPVERPLESMFETTRYWVWFARLINAPRDMLMNPTCPELVAVALQVFGAEAKAIWGYQWIKVLEMLYDAVTTGMGDDHALLGGPSASAARGRVQIEIERIMSL